MGGLDREGRWEGGGGGEEGGCEEKMTGELVRWRGGDGGGGGEWGGGGWGGGGRWLRSGGLGRGGVGRAGRMVSGSARRKRGSKEVGVEVWGFSVCLGGVVGPSVGVVMGG